MALSVSLPFLKGSIFMPIGIYKGQLISKQNCRAVTSPKKRKKLIYILSIFSSQDSELHTFVFWEKLRLDNFVSRLTDLYIRTL